MLSFSKLLLLAVVVGLVWFGWRWVARVQAVGRARMEGGGKPAPSPKPERANAAPFAARPVPAAEDMEKCPECGAYVVPRSAVSCGRPACPYGR